MRVIQERGGCTPVVRGCGCTLKSLWSVNGNDGGGGGGTQDVSGSGGGVGGGVSGGVASRIGAEGMCSGAREGRGACQLQDTPLSVPSPDLSINHISL